MTFVHVETVEEADAANPLTATSAFDEFVRDIGTRCEVPPVASDAQVVGSYRSFTGD